MLWLLAVIPGVLSTLKSGEDPYKILGIRKTATEEEIRKAYLGITKKHHPDISKDPASEKIWVRATDAYEILKDPSRRRIYDQTGSTAEDAAEHERDMRHHYYSGPSYQTDELSYNSFQEKLDKVKEMIIFVSFQDIFSMIQFGQLFENVAAEFKEFTTFARVNANDRRFAHALGLTSAPCFVYVRQEKNGQMTVKQTNSVGSRDSMVNWIVKCWDAQIEIIKSVKSLQKWITSNLHSTLVIAIERGNDAGYDFKKKAGRHRSIKYAVLIADYVNAIRTFSLTAIPALLVFRGGVRENQATLKGIAKLDVPLLAKLERGALEEACYDKCLVHIGEPTDDLVKKFASFTEAGTMWIPVKSGFAKGLDLSAGEWILVSGRQRKYAKIAIEEKYAEISKFAGGRLKMSPMDVEIDWSWGSRWVAVKRSLKGMFGKASGVGGIIGGIGNPLFQMVFLGVLSYFLMGGMRFANIR
jgi:hypothetical protein